MLLNIELVWDLWQWVIVLHLYSVNSDLVQKGLAVTDFCQLPVACLENHYSKCSRDRWSKVRLRNIFETCNLSSGASKVSLERRTELRGADAVTHDPAAQGRCAQLFDGRTQARWLRDLRFFKKEYTGVFDVDTMRNCSVAASAGVKLLE